MKGEGLGGGCSYKSFGVIAAGNIADRDARCRNWPFACSLKNGRGRTPCASAHRPKFHRLAGCSQIFENWPHPWRCRGGISWRVHSTCSLFTAAWPPCRVPGSRSG